jgi:hypothetical protein
LKLNQNSLKTFLKTVENENQIKLNDLIESLKETEQRKKAEDRNRVKRTTEDA